MKKLDNRYILLHELGEGGMGTVFLAHDQLRNNKKVAVKTIRNSFFNSHKNAAVFFKNEFLILSNLKHPNLVTVEDFGVDEIDGSYYLVMEYLTGRTLKQLISDEGKLSQDVALNLLVQTLRALEYIHSRDIVLRDLKPDNIFITTDEKGNYVVKILDFGLADWRNHDHKEIKGTASYLAPEVFCGVVTPRTDIFAAGVILYEMLTGDSFYKNRSLKSVISSLTSQRRFTDNLNLESLQETPEKKVVFALTAFKDTERPASAATAIDFINSNFKTNYPAETTLTGEAYIQHMRFVDKHQEFAFLLNYLNGKVANTNNIIFITGNSGTGKTRLLNHLKNYCLVHNTFFLTGDGEGYRHGYANAFREMIYYASKKLIDKYCGYLYQILPDHPLLKSSSLLEKLEPEENKIILISNLVDFLYDFQKEKHKKIVLWFSCFEDANELTCDFVQEIVNRKINTGDKADKLVVIADIKDNLKEIPFTVAQLLKTMDENNQLAKLVLQPFTKIEGATYFQQMFGLGKISRELEAQLMHILQETEGNPFYLQEIIKAFILNKKIVKIKGIWQQNGVMELPDLPDKLSYLINNRLKTIMRRKTDLEILNMLAILNRPVNIKEIEILNSDCSEIRILSSLDYLIQHDLIKEEDGSYWAANQLIIQAVIEKINPAKMDRLKCKIASELAFYYGIDRFNIYRADRLQTCEIAELYLTVEKIPSNKINTVLLFLEAAAHKYGHVFACEEAVRYLKKACLVLQELKGIKKSHNLRLLNNYLLQVKYLHQNNNYTESESILQKAYDLALNYGTWKDLNEIYNLTGWMFHILGDNTQSFEYYNRQIELLNQVNPENKSFSAQVYGNLGNYYLAVNQISKAKECFEIKYNYFAKTKNNSELSSVLGNMSVAEIKLGKYDNAIRLLKKKIRSDVKINNLSGLSNAYGSLAVVFLEQKDHENTLRYARLQYKISRKIGNKAGVSAALANMSSSYISKHEFHKALPLLMDKSKIDQEIGNKKGLSITLGNLGIVFKHFGKYEKALDFYLKKHSLAMSMNNQLGVAIALSNKAELLVELGEFEQADKNYDEAIQIVVNMEYGYYEGIFRYCKSYLYFIEKKPELCRKEINLGKTACLKFINPDILKNLTVLELYLDYQEEAELATKEAILNQVFGLLSQEVDGLGKTEKKFLLVQFLISQPVKPLNFDFKTLVREVKNEFESYHGKKYIIEKYQYKVEYLAALID